jgi:putative membrane protein
VTPGDLGGVVVVLALCCLWHAVQARGVRSGLAFLAVAVAVSWSFEEIGVVTGLVFGRYHYTATLGPWVGSVPLVIPLAWFALAYGTFALVHLVASRWMATEPGARGSVAGRAAVSAPGSRGRLVGLALVGACLMAGWDLVLDPILSGPVYHAWIWGTGEASSGVPVQNSLGWTATAFAIYVLCGWALPRAATARDGGRLRPPRAARAPGRRRPGS